MQETVASNGSAPILEARNIVKHFGHVQALRGVDFAAHAGEITALIGDNGAGKSTLVKILSGVFKPSSGQILVQGREVTFSSPADAHAQGLETVYQDLSVAQDLSPAANMFMGREKKLPGFLGKLGFLDKAAMRRGERGGVPAPEGEPASDMDDTDRQPCPAGSGSRVAICRSDDVGQGRWCSWTSRPRRWACCRPAARWNRSAASATPASPWC